ncbi:MAG: type II secretion system protein N [Pseudomonadales bacterium]|nr:type II secretion system protein N [Pseudomonadales bacterium]MDG1442125.1 type II secretion system protein N [Pseudomonadales bacterium]
MNAVVDWFNQYNKILVTLTNVVLVVLLSLSLANVALLVLEELDNAPETSPNATQTPLNNNQTKKNYGLAALDLFGSVEEKEQPKLVDAPKTKLNLDLQGVFTAEDEAESSAIIAQKGKSGELYQIGDKLPGNATLHAVFDDHVLIKRSARIEKLPFLDNALAGQFQSVSDSDAIEPGGVADSPNARLKQVRERITKRSQEASDARLRRQQKGSNLKSQIAAYQQRLDTEPDAVLSELGISPVSDSEASGYKIGAEVSQAILRQSGLKKGDVILSVNGKPVGNVSNDKMLLNQAVTGKRVRVEVQRDTRRFFVTVPIPD